jgi:hypothetical protein
MQRHVVRNFNRFLPAFLAVVTLLVLAPATSRAQITPVGDSYTNSADPTTNYGAATLLSVDGAIAITYIQFPLSSIPSGATVSAATLKLYVNSVTTVGSFNVDYVSGSWTESKITYDVAPALGNTIVSSVPLTSASKNQYILIDVTSAVQAWLSGSETNNGIALVANGTFNATFDSKENTTTSHPAELDIAYAGGDGTIAGVTTASGSGLMGGGTSGTLNLSLTNSCAANQILQWSGSAWACSNIGAGTVTSVAAGTGLTASPNPITGAGTLSINTSVVPLLSSNNTFTGSLVISDNSTYQPFMVQSSSTFGTWLELSNTSTGGQTWNIFSAASGNGEGTGNLGITNLHGGTIWLEGPVNSGALSSSGNIAAAGQIGIGTTAPRSTLDLEAAVAGGLGPTVTMTNNGGHGQVSLDLNTYPPSSQGTYNPGARLEAVDDGNYSDHLYFQSNIPGAANNGLHTNMAILSNGQVGIGTTSPTSTLAVNGTVSIGGDIPMSSNPHMSFSASFPGSFCGDITCGGPSGNNNPGGLFVPDRAIALTAMNVSFISYLDPSCSQPATLGIWSGLGAQAPAATFPLSQATGQFQPASGGAFVGYWVISPPLSVPAGTFIFVGVYTPTRNCTVGSSGGGNALANVEYVMQ